MRSLACLCGWVLFVCGTAVQGQTSPGKHALLVACTKYDHLKEAQWLRGPANDVLLMQDFLQKKFDFPAANITILSEAKGGNQRPLRAHIEREMARLAQVAKPGDQVLILLSGHGSRQPQRNTDQEENFEPDGLDNIFLPADVKDYDPKIQGVPNAVVDDDLKVWLQAIQAKGASIVVIVDACHSATMIRGNDVPREVPVEQLIPKAVIDAARAKAASRGGATRSTSDRPPFVLQDKAAGLVAIYAAQRTEPTIEKALPPESEDAKPYGILTYNLVKIVSSSPKPITYTELVQRIQAQYVEWGRAFPTPLVEGKDKDKEFLGTKEWKGRSSIQVSKNEDGEYRINAGALQRLTAGSILAVYPPAGSAKADQPIGHVRIRQLRTMDATVELCEYAKLPAPKIIPPQNRCQVAFSDYSIGMRLLVAFEESSAKTRGVGDQVAKEMDRLGQEKQAVFQKAKDLASADWLVRLEDDKAVLVPGTGVARGNASNAYGPVPIDDKFAPWLENNLGRIARARNLVALASAADNSSSNAEGIDVGVEVLRYPDPSQRDKFEVVRAQGRGLAFEAGDTIGFRVSNRGRAAVDVSLLFVDSGYGISSYFPPAGQETDNRLLGGKSLITPRARINAKTIGLEHLVVIAVKVKTDEPPSDFSFLAQPTLELAAKNRGAKDPSFSSPLGELFQSGLYRTGTTRGMSAETMNEYDMQVISWRSQPRPAK